MTCHRTFWRNLTRVHKWAGAVLGLQILLWFGSGFFMAMAPIDTVRGRHLLNASTPTEAVLSADLNAIAAAHGEPFQTLDVRKVAGRVVASIDGKAFYGRDGKPLTELPREALETAALSAYGGQGGLEALTRLDTAPPDYRGELPVWQARFGDSARTRLYLDPMTGDVRSVRTRLWRAFDFAWSLHIMDWTERTRFNTWWLRLASGAALLFALSGLALVVQRTLLRPRRRHAAVA